MTRDDISLKVFNILSKQLSVPVNEITEHALIGADLGADSLDTAEIAMMVKDDFNYDLKDDEVSSIKTVKDVIEVLYSNLVRT